MEKSKNPLPQLKKTQSKKEKGNIVCETMLPGINYQG